MWSLPMTSLWLALDPQGLLNHIIKCWGFAQPLILDSLTRSVVAARLANAGQSVLLLEAGSDGSLLTEIPAAVGATLGSSLDW